MSTTTDLAVREQGALAIEAGQTRWTEMQEAAFGQLGIADAPVGDKQVFLHVSQRTGLDPFAKQIYMIGRSEKKNVKQPSGRWEEVWSTKYTIQTGIEGFRVIRGRAERYEGVRGILSRPVFYNGAGEEFKVWFFKSPPAAVELTYTVRDRKGVETPYTSILRYDEYVQTKKVTQNGVDAFVPVSQWATKPTHMLEKCTEADVYRKAFPQDYSGVDLEDAMPAADPDAPPIRVQSERVPVTAEQARQRRAEHVTTTVVPAATVPAEPAADPQQGAEEAQDPTTSGASSSAHAPASGSQPRNGAQSPNSPNGSETTPANDDPARQSASKGAHAQAKRLFGDDRETRLMWAARILRTENDTDVKSFDHLTLPELQTVRDTLAKCKTIAALEALLTAGETTGA